MIKRLLENKFIYVLKNFKILYLAGARQTGKSTFVKYIASKLGYRYVNLDDDQDRYIAINDPDYFFELYQTPLIIDEIQKAPNLINRIKQFADNSTKNGQFILTGSANLLALPNLQETLTGRMAILNLYPFSTFELNNLNFNLIETLFDRSITTKITKLQCKKIDFIAEMLYRGLFPAITNLNSDLLGLWFEAYINTRLLKEIDTLTERNLHKHQALNQLLPILANQTANLLNISNLAKDLKIHYQTAKAYTYFLEQIFVIEKLPPFFSNITKQVLKTPKLYFIDTGLVSYLTSTSLTALKKKQANFGSLLENFIYLELRKHISFLTQPVKMFFFRGPNTQYEVDFILQNSDGELITIEVKASSQITPSQLKGTKYFAQKFPVKHSYVFYGGTKPSVIQLNNHKIYLLPYCALF